MRRLIELIDAVEPAINRPELVAMVFTGSMERFNKKRERERWEERCNCVDYFILTSHERRNHLLCYVFSCLGSICKFYFFWGQFVNYLFTIDRKFVK